MPVHILVLVGIGLSIAGNFAYARDTLLGKTKPNRVTWFMWGLAPTVGAVIALASGVDPWVAARVLVAGVLPLCVFFISFVDKQAYWKLTSFDVTCGILSMCALVLWILSQQAGIAILLLIVADVFASIPTVVKAWKHPETETAISYILFAFSFVVVLPVIPAWNIENAGFQLYLLGINALLVLIIYRKLLSAQLLPK